MKKLALTFIVFGLLTGAAFAAETKQSPCQAECSCSKTQKAENSVFNPLFPEFEVQPPMGG
ncbi:MAG: hypothetical protein IH614_20380 [Desulfuromonadales bacterium]|nr:hypothetical protein [Desulfuromonadales bacterium]